MDFGPKSLVDSSTHTALKVVEPPKNILLQAIGISKKQI
jgi:hypothetical protein